MVFNNRTSEHLTAVVENSFHVNFTTLVNYKLIHKTTSRKLTHSRRDKLSSIRLQVVSLTQQHVNYKKTSLQLQGASTLPLAPDRTDPYLPHPHKIEEEEETFMGPPGKNVRTISQEAFDELVKENIEDLGLDPTEALEDAIQTLTLQGVDLSGNNSIKNPIFSFPFLSLGRTNINKITGLLQVL